MPKTTRETRAFARTLRHQPTDAERALWQHLRHDGMLGVRFRRQVPIGPYIADFACIPLKIIIELDGSQHADATDYDLARTSYLERLGFRVIRFWNRELFTERRAVLNTIWIAVDEAKRREIPS